MGQRATKTIKTITEFHRSRGVQPPDHPLISVIDYHDVKRPSDIGEVNWMLNFYMISLKIGINGQLKYGQQDYDFDEGTMFFISPNQVFRIETDENPQQQKSGWMLLIHPDFLWNTSLAKTIKKYDFFDYSVNEALFLSKKEEQVINGIIENIEREYHANIDKFSQNIIVSHIETLLNYSERFYERQFITRKITSHEVLDRLEELLDGYIGNNDLMLKGLPTVQQIADKLHMSSNYLSRLLTTLTGQSTQQFIHDKLIEKAKEKLSATNLSISEIAYELGFEHPQSFTRLFKNKTHLSPLEFRNSFN
ncbi:AraC family transcriptional regulator [Chryseobacterium lactis]|uniref:AraC family transcriptional regulator n=1 Tax=Chryseobacterium lactis TaxID=1241981 RepID=A0A3G6RTI6_CHRLC|nr:helix-turn-helix transcriptional regulator [Chryseobacterium lactis]AZA84412.1 AraC family transcriptional regulator [Chryseobacterium lactis]AZB04800.1 AraC family transcriptional regulator [Chryseobacterium lactis]PNW14531.1 AraC family transcriptional regulator [Chryseobacterium lactis]